MNAPATGLGGNLHFPGASNHHRIVSLGQQAFVDTSEGKIKAGLEFAFGIKLELDPALHSCGRFLDEVLFFLLGEDKQVGLHHVTLRLRISGEAARVDLDLDDAGAILGKVAAHGDVGQRVGVCSVRDKQTGQGQRMEEKGGLLHKNRIAR